MKRLLLAAALLATPALAQTQAQLNQRAAATYARADAAMAAQWKRTYAYMKGRDAQDTSRGGGFGYAAAMLESQRAWLRFRDTQCVVEGGLYAGGTAQGMVQTNCKTRLTDQRARDLKGLILR